MNSPKRPAMFDAIVLTVFQINARLQEAGDNLTAPLGQTAARWRVLGRVHRAPQTVPQIARSMGQTRQAVQRIADLLVKDGLAAYQRNASDKRTQLLNATALGLETLDAIGRAQALWAKQIESNIDPELLTRLRDDLLSLHQALINAKEKNDVQ